MIGPGVTSILRNGLYLLGSGWLAYGLRALYVIALARFLGPEGYGLIAYAQALYFLVIGFIGFGLEIILPREVGRDRERGGEVLRLLMTIRLATTLAGAAAFLAIGLWAEPTASGQAVILVLSLALLGRSLAILAQQAFVAYEESRFQLLVSAVFRTAELIAGGTALVLGADVLVIAAIHSASWIAEGLAALFLVDRRLAGLRGRRDWTALPVLLREGAVIGLARALGIWLGTGPLVLYRYTVDDTGAVGVLSLALQGTMLLAGAISSFMAAAIPVLSRSVARADGRDAVYLDAANRLGLLLGALGWLVGTAFGPWLVNTLVGPAYAETGALLGLALLSIAPITQSAAIGQLFMVRGQVTVPLWANVAAAAVLTAGLPIAVAEFGATGAIAAILAAWGVKLTILFAFLRKSLGTLLSPSCIRLTVAAAAVIAIQSVLPPASMTVTTLFVSTAIIVLPIMALSARERDHLAELLARLGSRALASRKR